LGEAHRGRDGGEDDNDGGIGLRGRAAAAELEEAEELAERGRRAGYLGGCVLRRRRCIVGLVVILFIVVLVVFGFRFGLGLGLRCLDLPCTRELCRVDE
jgi:hypothetical protein